MPERTVLPAACLHVGLSVCSRMSKQHVQFSLNILMGVQILPRKGTFGDWGEYAPTLCLFKNVRDSVVLEDEGVHVQ